MKPFIYISEISTKFSIPSTKQSNNKQHQNTTTNNNINLNNNNNHKKAHSTQYKNAIQIFNSLMTSDKYFESLNKELNNYLVVTNLNNINLKELYNNKLEMIENILQNGLSS